ncbi:S100P-binding protein [Pelodytes ibericus]
MENSLKHGGWISPTGHCERQVVCFSSFQHSHPEAMEEIRISIVNDLATGTKHRQEDILAVSPSHKRMRSAVFTCSTPCSSSSYLRDDARTSQTEGTMCSSDVTKQENEWDDSLLDASDSEGDSPLHLTVDEIESLLKEDPTIDAKESGWDSEGDDYVQNLKSEDHEIVNDAPHSVQENYTDIESDTSNYAAMAPSHCTPLTSSAKMDTLSGESSTGYCTMKALFHCSTAVDQVVDCGSRVSDFGLEITPGDQGFVEEQREGSELSFDGDINDLLALSPCSTSAEEDTIHRNLESKVDQINSTPIALPLDPPQILVSVTDDSTEAKASTKGPLPTCNKLGHPKPFNMASFPTFISFETPMDINSHSLAKTQQDQKSSSSLVIEPEQKTAMKSELKCKTNKKPSNFVNKPKVSKCNTQQKISTPVDSRLPVTSDKPKAKKSGNVPLCTTYRPQISINHLEANKVQYTDRVMMHLDGPSTSKDPNYELGSLLNQVSRENSNWQHPSDFTRRNHPRSGRKRPSSYSLEQWVLQNGGSEKRFQGLPCTFKRSPIPRVLPP